MLPLTALLVIVVIVLLWYSYPNSNYHEKYSGKSYQRKAPSLYRYEAYEHPSEEQHRTAEQFNWKSQNRLTFIATVFAIIAGTFAILTYHETKRQADIAQQSLVLQNRAWVDIDQVVPDEDFTWYKNSYQVVYNVRFSNIGASIATIYHTLAISYEDLDIFDEISKFQKNCQFDKFLYEKLGPIDRKGIIFPHGFFVQRWGGYNPVEADRDVWSKKFPHIPVISISGTIKIAACILYKTIDGKIRITVRFFDVFRAKDINGVKKTYRFVDGETVPKAFVSITPSYEGDYAD